MKTDFEAYTDTQAAQMAHAQEITNTRVGGLGGSDASILLKIGQCGMDALSQTDCKRLAVMMGIERPVEFGGNKFTAGGHSFEDYVDKYFGMDWQREVVMERELADRFKTFAHADFVANGGKRVIECKFSGKSTEAVLKTYEAQLQWYYMLGAEAVALLHGTGEVHDDGTIEVEDTNIVKVERDELMVGYLLDGIKTLDDAIKGGWKPVASVAVALEHTTEDVKLAIQALKQAKELTAEAKEIETEAKSVLLDYMAGLGYSSIYSDDSRLTLTSGRTTTRFDLKAFEQLLGTDETRTYTHAEVLELIQRAKKTTTGEASLTFKQAKSEEK